MIDKEFDALFEICVDRYHQYRKAADMIEFYGDQMMTLNAANALLKQEIKRLESKLKLKEMH